MFLRSVSGLLLLASALVAGPLAAADGAAQYQPCVACHGAKGEGNEALKAPRLAGQDAWYLKMQLEKFANGERGSAPGDAEGAQMLAMAALLKDDASRSAVSEYLAALATPVSLAPAPAPAPASGVAAGQYNAVCSACHGAKALGTKALKAPKLTGLSVAYLTRQLEKFRLGQRGYHANDKAGAQMRRASSALTSEAQSKALAEYIASLPVAAGK